jgi:hypothetical protein
LRRRVPSAAVSPVFALGLAAAVALGGCELPSGGRGFARSGASRGTAPTALSPAPSDSPSSPPLELAFDGDPDALIGREAGEIERALGPPRMVRRDAPAEIWQYRSETCVLDLFLYQEKQELRVAYLEARDQEAQAVPPRGCFASVLAAQRAARSS